MTDMANQIITRIFLLLAIFGFAVNVVGFGYLIYNTIRLLLAG
jgi:hypothetical protein